MSGLAGLLAGHRAPGVYRWHAGFDVEHVRHAVEHAGRRFGYVDGWAHPGKAGVLAALGEALELPGWYGRNLDALVDCLRELPADTVVLWEGWGVLAEEDERSFRVLLEVLEERAGAAGPTLSVLLRGHGPEELATATGVADLD